MNGKHTNLCIVMVGVFVAFCFPLQASAQVDELISSLSNAKAQLEGRASRVQSCNRLRSGPIVEDLRSKFDDARNSHNSRIDGWLYILKTQTSKVVEETLETNKLNEARQRANTFLAAADQVLKKGSCGTKVLFFKEGVLLALNLGAPYVIDGLVSLLKDAGRDAESRANLIKILQQQRIDEWIGIKAYVVYDWSTEKIVPQGKIDEALLRKASTSIYVNQWALEANPGPLIVKDKLAPDELSGAHLLYTGKIKDLSKFTGAVKENGGGSPER